MAAPALRFATYDDLLRLPREARAEVIGGVVYEGASPAPRHGRAMVALGRYVGGPFDQDDDPGGWWILAEVDVRFSPSDILRPDLAGWRRERMPLLPASRPIDIVPDWVCEIRSPSTASHDVLRKRPLYAAHGVPWLWAVDPEARIIVCFENRGGTWAQVAGGGDGEKARLPPFEATEIDVSRVFGPASDPEGAG